jgi:hypothetical protein
MLHISQRVLGCNAYSDMLKTQNSAYYRFLVSTTGDASLIDPCEFHPVQQRHTYIASVLSLIKDALVVIMVCLSRKHTFGIHNILSKLLNKAN